MSACDRLTTIVSSTNSVLNTSVFHCTQAERHNIKSCMSPCKWHFLYLAAPSSFLQITSFLLFSLRLLWAAPSSDKTDLAPFKQQTLLLKQQSQISSLWKTCFLVQSHHTFYPHRPSRRPVSQLQTRPGFSMFSNTI